MGDWHICLCRWHFLLKDVHHSQRCRGRNRVESRRIAAQTGSSFINRTVSINFAVRSNRGFHFFFKFWRSDSLTSRGKKWKIQVAWEFKTRLTYFELKIGRFSHLHNFLLFLRTAYRTARRAAVLMPAEPQAYDSWAEKLEPQFWELRG